MRRSIVQRVVVLLALVAAKAGETSPGFVLPARLHAAPGHECNVYFRNVFSSVTPQNYAFEAESPVGRAQIERWCWTPSPADAGRLVPLVLRAWNDAGCVAAVTVTVEVASVPFRPERTSRLALFADSLTNSGYQDELFRVLRADGFSGYTPVGSRRPRLAGRVPHDGYGGYDCKAFLSYYNVTEEEFARVQDSAEREQLKALGVPVKVVAEWQRELLKSPLVTVENGRKKVDVSAWMTRASGGVPPEVVVIQLGVNAVFGLRGDARAMRQDIRTRVIPEFDQFLAALRPHMPKAVFAIATVPLGCGQDGFGANYGAKSGEIQHRITVFELNRELIAHVRDLADPLVEIIPLAQAIDPRFGFLHAEERANARTDETIRRDRNALHPSASGGCQMADALAAWYACRWNEWSVRGKAFHVGCLNVGLHEHVDGKTSPAVYEEEERRLIAASGEGAFFMEEAAPGEGKGSLAVRTSGPEPLARDFVMVTNVWNGRQTRCCAALRLQYRFNGRTVAVYGVHLVPEGHVSKVKDPRTGHTPSQGLRQRQFADLLADAAQFDAAILTGDFNAQEPWEYDIFTRNGWKICNCSDRYGVTATLRDIPADNIIVSDELDIVDFRIPTRDDYRLSTDHRPLLATVAFQEEEEAR